MPLRQSVQEEQQGTAEAGRSRAQVLQAATTADPPWRRGLKRGPGPPAAVVETLRRHDGARAVAVRASERQETGDEEA